MQDTNMEKGATIPSSLEIRIKKAVKLAGGVPVVAKSTASGVSTVYNYMKLEPPPPLGWCYALAQVAGVRAAWLFTGEEPMVEGDEVTQDALRSRGRVPLMEFRVSAGGGSEPLESAPIGDVTFPYGWLESLGNPAAMELVPAQGDSMEPEIGDGDYVLYDKSQTKVADGLFVVRLEEYLLVKRLQVEGRIVRLVSTNPLYDPVPVDLKGEEGRLGIIGKVVWTGRKTG